MRPALVGFLAVLLAPFLSGIDGRQLFDAVRGDDRRAVEQSLREGLNPNERDSDGTSPLAWAVMRSNLEISAILQKAGADPNLTNELGIGPLALAIANGSAAMVTQLLANRADPNVARENGETPLMTASRIGRTDIMKLLLDRGAKVNAQDHKYFQTALMWAAGQPEAVRLLLDHGADIHARTKTWDVKYTIYLPTTATLGKTGIPWNNEGDYTAKKGGLNALHFAVQNNDLNSAGMLLDAGLDVNSPTADGTTPLLGALFKWDPPKGTFVPGKGGPATAGSSQRFSPDLRLAKLLLDRGASVKAVDGAGYTPLHGAALAVAKAARSGTRQKGAYGQTAAALALGSDDGSNSAGTLQEALAIVQRLLDGGADPNKQTIYPTGGPAGDVRINPAPPGSSAMHLAASSGNVELFQILNGHGGNPNLVRKDGHTPFSVAVLTGDLSMVKELVVHGAEVNARWDPQDKIPDPVESIALARQSQSILHLAAIAGKPEILEFLHSKGASLDVKNSLGETPFDLADKQERYREAIQRQNADGNPEELKKVVRRTTGTEMLRKLSSASASR